MAGMGGIAQGIDMVDCSRLRQAIDRHGRRFIDRVFTAAEQKYSLGKKREIEHLAGRFAAKEAVLKLLGTGLIGKMKWTDVEVVNESTGQPKVRLSGECLATAQRLKLGEIQISISHIDTHAIASAIAMIE
jgi:holo-[acyl-carrier protein] synthase